MAGSDGSISASVASIQPQPSSGSAPSSPGSRRSVSTLKKWLTTPVRKLSTGSLAKGERKPEGRPRRGGEGRRHGRQEERKSIDLGLLGKANEPLITLRQPKATVRALRVGVGTAMGAGFPRAGHCHGGAGFPGAGHCHGGWVPRGWVLP